MVEELVSRVSGFGPLQKYLDDPTVEEIWINDPSRVFVARAGRHELTCVRTPLRSAAALSRHGVVPMAVDLLTLSARGQRLRVVLWGACGGTELPIG
ncbi:hypothetical protein [Nocardioides mesophilus]|uniref:hypothetical protein n=1 Tax=Nocardioides mesophilus TaxID=433659 RepID=UPI001FE9FD87|nr:hypothetical protein [Nocardioides mesophilus]